MQIGRLRAAVIHLGASFIVACGVLMVIFFVWYPTPYFDALDGKGLVVIILAVDVVIGPLLTLVVYHPGKKSLKFDMAVIIVFQLTALSYGLWVSHASRVAYLVYSQDSFDLVKANEVDPDSARKSSFSEFKTLPWRGPVLAAARMPDDVSKRTALAFGTLAGRDLANFPEFYIPYVQALPEMRSHALDRIRLAKTRPELAQQISKFEQNRRVRVFVLPINVRPGLLMTALIDQENGALLETIPQAPY